MKLSADQLAQRLASELGAGAIANEASLLAAHAADGKQPGLICSPDTPEQVAAVLRVCAEAEAAVVPWGGGTAMRIGNPPRHVDMVMELSRLNRLVEHDDANLTATVQAGMNLTDMQMIVARRKQFLPFDPPHPTRATIGGIVAANLNGPRRMAYGAVRDLVIGMKVALITGAQIKVGGKVVKNVAGYDMCKLFVGSLGTLGIITEVTVRVAPIPETVATFAATGALAQTLSFIGALSHSALLPTSVTILNAAAANSGNIANHEFMAGVSCEGFKETVARHLSDLQKLAQQAGLQSEILKDDPHRALWSQIQDVPLNSEQLVYRITVPLASVAELIKTVESWTSAEGSTKMIADAGTGTVWFGLQPNESAIAWFSRLISLAQQHRGHAVLFSAPPVLKHDLDVWGPAVPSLKLMRDIKHQFDPRGLLNPGRFVAGL